LAYFSTREPGRGAGLYVTSIARPWLAKKILGQTGDSLRWGAVLGTEPIPIDRTTSQQKPSIHANETSTKHDGNNHQQDPGKQPACHSELTNK
jgi:hypothetical protein